MKKTLIGMSLVVLFAAVVSAIDKPTVSLTKTSPSGGFEMRDLIVDDLTDAKTAIDAVIDVVDEVVDSDKNVTPQDLTVEGTATFKTNVVFTATTTEGSETATLTNAPASGNPSLWLTVMVGTNTYVVPAFPAE
jgi:hypothetical protein